MSCYPFLVLITIWSKGNKKSFLFNLVSSCVHIKWFNSLHFVKKQQRLAMEKLSLLYLALLLSVVSLHGSLALGAGTSDGSEQWGYVEVRPKAHLFWWLYRSPYRVEDPSKPWPVILWLQGGPGASSVGLGNFGEMGPLDTNLEPRNSTWLRKADLLFVDSPVGTGFSYAEEEDLLVRTDEDAATDLTTLLKALFNGNEALQKSPLYIFAESYGGKFAVTLGLSAAEAIERGELKLQLGGVALGNSWISPEDFVFSWGPLLKDLSRLNDESVKNSNRLAQKIKQQLAENKTEDAEVTWEDLEHLILLDSNGVDFYNFMLDVADVANKRGLSSVNKYSSYLSTGKSSSPSAGANVGGDLDALMNGPIRQKLKIIPKNVTWGGQGFLVFAPMRGDFMRPRIQEVDELLAKGIDVTIYNGQLDLICATKGVEAWINKLKWDGLGGFLSMDRTPLYCGSDKTTTKGFTASYRNLAFFWILGAGHFVPVDQPCVSLQMVGNITRSPSHY